MGWHGIGLESIAYKWNHAYNRYTFVDDDDESDVLFTNRYLSEQYDPLISSRIPREYPVYSGLNQTPNWCYFLPNYEVPLTEKEVIII